ncbi:Permease of the drug/metabolite transporter (DMT) superfamily [Devosia enhydra]|uniref:Permease of the drug/metabolite transporter (DMT) superfamily n=1 Tax=Devosia enhydra TaxID=665118 RepID=A0A1K2HX70_9HYPH|nr:DMT family transporter [Devosia enhydra]SFZ83572.1 Permease of the drug/metabolite transporter (DMT) superfamily [Devosia enhydra]
MSRPKTSAPGALDWAALFLLIAVWGTSFAVIKIALAGIGPNWLAAGRLTIAAMLVAIVIAPRLRPLPRRRDYLALLLLGIVGNTVPFVFIGWASLTVPSGVVGLVMATSPIQVMLLSLVLLPEEKLTPARLAGLLLGFSGVALVIFGREQTGVAMAPAADVLPYLALLVAAGCYALNTIIARRLGAIPVAARGFGVLAGAGLAATLFAALTEPFPVTAPAESLLALLYLAAIPTAAAGMLVYWLLDRTSARFVVQTNYIVPVIAVAVGAVMLGETLGPLQYGGVLVILAGLLLAEQVWRRR